MKKASDKKMQTVILESDIYAQEIDWANIHTIARITLASPEQVLQWSRRHCRQTDRYGRCRCGKTPEEQARCPFGEVKKPETINYRTFKPEKDGLFCERIFGPVKDWECACGKYKGVKYKGIICDRCGVEVTESRVRRTRMGHIKLAAPVCHIWFYRGTSSKISSLLDISAKDLHKIGYFQEYVVVDPGDTPLKPKQLLIEDEYRKYKELYGNKVKIMTGAEAISELLKREDIDVLASRLAIEMREATSAQKRAKIVKRLKVVESLRNSGNRPEWMVLEVLPVLPPDLRPLVHLDGGRFATSDLNDLYRRVINRNNRLRKLIELRAPEVILKNEKRMLQEAVDALFDNSRRLRPIKGHNNRPLKSLSDMLKGKQGRFRQNLLGKRVDYSGRSVIVVGPDLKFNECGLPKKMCLELFDPFIIRELIRRGHCATIKNAKKMIEREDPIVYDILDEIIRDHPVLLNRAPTLHRLGVQAFYPVLIEGKAIQLHPLSCAAFNADFDGDQMAVHIPLSAEAKLEAKMIMLAENNILSPAHGKPIATPSQDIVLGCHYLTKLRKGAKGEGKMFASPEEAIFAYQTNAIDLQAEIIVRINGNRVKTSVGRLIFNSVLPPEVSYFNEEYPFANEVLGKKSLAEVVAVLHKTCGAKRTAEIMDKIKELGFYYAKKSGVSFSMDELVVPPSKKEILEATQKEVARVQQLYEKGVITNDERYHRIIDLWTHASDRVAADMQKALKQHKQGFNSIYMMAESGSRGSEAQIRQLAGMRGLMQRPTKRVTGAVGEIIETPIKSNFREGLSVVEYFISTHGARKGLADTALKTSDAGYLTRRLVDVAQELIIIEEDCKTFNFINQRALKELTPQGERELLKLADRITGFVAAKDIVDPRTNQVLCKRNQLITDEIATAIIDAGLEEVPIRSVLTCEARRGICRLCYGINPATSRLVELGETIGIIAAQSIGEPGTQLTLRTFHVGGTASRELEGWYQATADGFLKFKNLRLVKHAEGYYVVVNRRGSILVQDEYGNTLQTIPTVPYGARITKNNGDPVKKDERIVEYDPHHIPIIADCDGILKFDDIIKGVTMKIEVDPITNVAQMIISEYKEERHPQLLIVDNKGEILYQYPLAAGSIVVRGLKDGSRVQAGQVLARLPRVQARSRDITGGLPRVDELVEARHPKDCAFLSEVDGVFKFKGIARGARKVAVITDSGEERRYSIPITRHLLVRDGERVQAGDKLTDGSINPHDILRIKGEKAVMQFLLDEIQSVYRLQGVSINDKHISCITRQMLRKVVIEDVGSTRFLYGQLVDKWAFLEENERVLAEGGQPATARPRLLGITKSSLETESFIAAASFQETTRVLTDAAIRGRMDYLYGLKENVIMGLLIPAGTGLPRYRNIDVVGVDEEVSLATEAETAPAAPVATEEKAAPEKPKKAEKKPGRKRRVK